MSLPSPAYIVGRRILDALWFKDNALPSAASTTVTGTTIDLDGGTALVQLADRPAEIDIFVQIPALTTTMLPDTRTLTITLLGGATSSPTTPISEAVVITGAGGVGSPNPQEFHFRLPPNGYRYIAARVVSGASTTDMSTLSSRLAVGF